MANPENLKPPWQPGQSGNPNGRPRKESSIRAAIAELLSEPEGDRDRLRALLESLYHRATRRGDTTAARLLLEYGFGRPDSLPDEIPLPQAIRFEIVETANGHRLGHD